MRSKSKLRLMTGIVVVVTGAIAGLIFAQHRAATTQLREPYNPTFRPADFVDKITNEYFPLTPGTTFIGEEPGMSRLKQWSLRITSARF